MATPHEQLQAMGSLAENWDGYGAAAPGTDVIELAEEFVGLMEIMRSKSVADASVMHVSPTRVGGVLIEWAVGLMEHEIEICADRSISFLHHNTSTGHLESHKFSPEPAVVQPGFIRELRRSLAA